MPVTFVDQLTAFVSVSANLAAFISDANIAAYAGTSFARRYGQGGFQVDSVTLGAPGAFELQQTVRDDPRIMGTEQRTDGSSGRKLYDFRIHRQEILGWVDATFTVPAAFNAHVVPGSLLLGPGAGVASAGVDFGPPPATFASKFLLSVTTENFTLDYPLCVLVFASADLSPTADLRRIRALRQFLERDPAFLNSLDGPPDQRPLLFVQVYPGGAANGSPITQQAISRMFDADDILAVFFTPPA